MTILEGFISWNYQPDVAVCANSNIHPRDLVYGDLILHQDYMVAARYRIGVAVGGLRLTNEELGDVLFHWLVQMQIPVTADPSPFEMIRMGDRLEGYRDRLNNVIAGFDAEIEAHRADRSALVSRMLIASRSRRMDLYEQISAEFTDRYTEEPNMARIAAELQARYEEGE